MLMNFFLDFSRNTPPKMSVPLSVHRLRWGLRRTLSLPVEFLNPALQRAAGLILPITSPNSTPSPTDKKCVCQMVFGWQH